MKDGWGWGDLKPLNYGVILADPPWRFDTWSPAGDNRAPEYDTMTLDQIKDLRVADLARSDCLLAMWAVDPLLDKAFDVIEAWGFRFVTVGFYWIKTGSKPGSYPIKKGYWTRGNPEQCLFAVRGAPARLDASISKLILAPAPIHSAKPDKSYSDLEALVGGPYCELFSRRTRPGWDAWGNQVGTLDG